MGGDLDMLFGPAGPGIISRDFGDEMVVANLDTGIFYSLGGSASRIWSGLNSGYTGRQIAASFPQDAAASVSEFLAQLLAEGLLVPAEAPVLNPRGLPGTPTFDAPTLERFDDLQGLLLIDPIHDVGEAGWPLLPQTAIAAE
ncbi:PqqD family protein [Roseomonas indoligenes]|uniref:PqqD family protein n=1 Tax=Roseomonas indoligenes TaxID=2820811 RepID=A0A940N2V7_9PROT|nr:PqqD family protein [Pararoseomonas indoligenes]MBP0495016.1 PqqD family protein [Pararoseomonas indoligenes]